MSTSRDVFEAARTAGATLAGYYLGMTENGVMPDEARKLTCEYFRSLIDTANRQTPAYYSPKVDA